jgi:hypothetical protein
MGISVRCMLDHSFFPFQLNLLFGSILLSLPFQYWPTTHFTFPAYKDQLVIKYTPTTATLVSSCNPTRRCRRLSPISTANPLATVFACCFTSCACLLNSRCVLRPCSRPIPTQNISSSTHHIKSFDTCMEH